MCVSKNEHANFGISRTYDSTMRQVYFQMNDSHIMCGYVIQYQILVKKNKSCKSTWRILKAFSNDHHIEYLISIAFFITQTWSETNLSEHENARRKMTLDVSRSNKIKS